MNNSNSKKITRRLSILFALVLFVFVIISISLAAAALFIYFFVHVGVITSLPPPGAALLLFLLLVSLITGAGLAIIGGKIFLRPIRNLVRATKEIASGNFNVRLVPSRAIEINQLALSFNEMAKELASIETLRSDFVSNISHEFKTPIASIKGFAKRLKKNDLTKEQRDEYLDIIITESERLTKLSSNILLLSKLEGSERTTDRNGFFLDEQIRKTLLLLEPQLKRKNLAVDVGLKEVRIVANEEIFQALWVNLLGNAIKFSPEGGTIGVMLDLDGENAIISISDMGAGIDEETQKHIFEKFYQGDRSRATEGNGLGLALVKRILELEHGEITVVSAINKGACFTVSLPVKPPLLDFHHFSRPRHL